MVWLMVDESWFCSWFFSWFGIPLRPLKTILNNVLLEHDGLPHVLPLTVHLFFFTFFLTGRGGHPKSLLLFEFSC